MLETQLNSLTLTKHANYYCFFSENIILFYFDAIMTNHIKLKKEK